MIKDCRTCRWGSFDKGSDREMECGFPVPDPMPDSWTYNSPEFETNATFESDPELISPGAVRICHVEYRYVINVTKTGCPCWEWKGPYALKEISHED